MIEMGQGGRVEGWGQVGAGWAGLRDWVGVGGWGWAGLVLPGEFWGWAGRRGLNN